MKKRCFRAGLIHFGSRAHLLRMTEVVAKADSGEKTSCFVDVCNDGNLTLWTYLGIKLIEINTYDVYST